MRKNTRSALHESQRRPLAACVASLFAFSVPLAAAPLPVTSCLDSGPGSLRAVVASATTGDTVDLSALVCPNSTISLSTGQIEVNLNDLTIKGPGAANLAIDGTDLPDPSTDNSRLFAHVGSGTLTFRDIRLTAGHIDHDSNNTAAGGCVFSTSNLELYSTEVVSCSAYSQFGAARGGGLYAAGSVKLHDSTVYKGEASSGYSYAEGGGIWAKGKLELNRSRVDSNNASTYGVAQGGGVLAYNGLTLSYSSLRNNTAKSTTYGAFGGGARVDGAFDGDYCTIADNSAKGDSSVTYGGGVFATGDSRLKRCTISGNHSDGPVGGFDAYTGTANTLDIRNSTISGNNSGAFTGGLFSDAATTRLYNTTVAFNTAALAHKGIVTFAPGVALNANQHAIVATLQSSLLSQNTYGVTEDDLSAATTILHPVTFNLGPANNFVRAYSATGLPGDTLNKACPLLGPLRDNGGPTLTHALMSSSVMIDAGNNVVNDVDNDQDQRGRLIDPMPYLYPRESLQVADIGAYEVNQEEIVFNSGFDGCEDT